VNAHELELELRRRGLWARVVSARHAAELEETIERLRESGLLDRDLDRDYLGAFDFTPPADLAAAESIIVMAVADPQVRVGFVWKGAALSALVPPTYRRQKEVRRRIAAEITGLLAKSGHRAVRAALPEKTLAVRCGLARYGRNNLAYVAGLGSFCTLVALWSDLPCEADAWQPPEMLPECVNCKACRRRCPTEAIRDDRFVIQAERCLTFWNEKPARIPFPEWIDPGWHDCLVGCMRCQWACPLNREFRARIVDGPSFNEDETACLLSESELENLPASVQRKLGDLGVADFPSALPRNLRALLERYQAAAATRRP
jgi:epoxyqueuosine reductase